jgi:MFS transporter, PPP family, 3-phenylpropionic acid transporter
VLGVLIPYWPLFLQAKGFEPRAIGAFMAILPATKIVAPSFWGWLSDRSGHPLRFIRWTSFLSFATMALLIPDIPDPRWIAGAMIGFGLFWNGPQPLLETVTLAYLKGRQGYGRVRLWGSIGYIVSVALGGLLLGEVLPINRLPQLLTALLAVQWLVTLLIPDITTRGDSLGDEPLGNILKRPQVLGFLMAALLIQLAHGPYYSFYSVFLSSHGFNDVSIGVLWGLGVLSEVLLFIWMDRLEGRFGLANLFLWGIVISVMRWAIIGWGVDVPALVVLAQVLHAGTFGLMHVASIALVHQHFKGGHHAKGQAIYSGFCYGVGGAAGSLYAGYLWQAVPASWVFLSASLMSLLAIGFAWPLIRGWRAIRG